MNNETNDLEVAVIGLAGRFPGSKNIAEFWDNLTNGREYVSKFDNSETAEREIKAAGLLADIDLFDAAFFGFSPKEAEIVDPQHRILLECAWTALENAGYDSEREERPIGVYAGIGTSTYLLYNLFPNNVRETLGYFPTLLAHDKDYAATRVSYKLNLSGPSVSVGTACSSSLVAVHLAYQSLLSGECDLALAAGVSIKAPQNEITLCPEGISPDGHCRAFDAKAQGTVGGNGVGVVVLKRLEDAIADRDYIYAVIKGSAINNDGAGKVSYTAPSESAQAKVIRAAQIMAEVEPETISYIETHGTGTALGDPIEVAALKQAFATEKKGFCALGSVKTNIGHLDAAAGIAGFIKTVLALEKKCLPPIINFETPNPQIDFVNSPFYVNTKLTEWKANGSPRRAGVSSFGFGGTNAHVILEESTNGRDVADNVSTPQLLILSAKTRSALDTATENLAAYLQQNPQLNLADVAYTLQMGRREFEYRRVVVGKDIEDATASLRDPQRFLTSQAETSEIPVVFLFTGLGTQYVNMAKELYQNEAVFQNAIARCCEFLKPLLGIDLREIIYPGDWVTSSNPTTSKIDLRQMLNRTSASLDENSQKLNQTQITQPAIFVIEYALAQLWLSWGIYPTAAIGYSIGEYVAATIAGVLSLEDALTLVAKRAQMIAKLPGGAMLAIPLAEAEVRPFLNSELSLSAVNGSKLCVVAGTKEAVAKLANQLAENGQAYRHLQTSHAFHSQMMEAIAQPFTELVKTINLKPPQIPYISNVTGTWITAAEATNPEYWTKHLCQPVRFADGIKELAQQQPIFLEVGPGQTLSSLTVQCLEEEGNVFSSLRDAYTQQSDEEFLLHTLGQLWLSGVKIDWSKFAAEKQLYRIPLPTYPFERQRYWLEPPKSATILPSSTRKSDPADWFYVPTWKQSILPEIKVAQKCSYLVFAEETQLSSQILQRLTSENEAVVTVRMGEKFVRVSEIEYTINPDSKNDYQQLLQSLQANKQIPHRILHLWSLKLNQEKEDFSQTQAYNFYSLLFLTQAISEQLINDAIDIWVISRGMHAIESIDVCHPEKATLLGLCKVIPQEYSNLTCHSLDLAANLTSPEIDLLLSEFATQTDDLIIAYRGKQRWLQTFTPVKLDKIVELPQRLRPEGVYLITGGLGRIGLTIAEYLARTVSAKLVLVGRSGLPPEASTKIEKVRQLEELGAEVAIATADVADETQMQQVFSQAEKRFGKVNGVIHAAAFIGEEIVRTIQETTPKECELQFRAKVYGLYTLEKILSDKEVDFCFLISSIGAVLGGVGFAAYTATNNFVDAFASRQNQLGKTHWCSANWFHAENTNLLRNSLAETTANSNETAVFQQETIDALQRIFSYRLVPQIAIWRTDLTAEIDKWLKRQSLPNPTAVTKSEQNKENSRRRTAYIAPRNETERQIAELYQEFLGIELVSIHDNFFALGGHSLLATQLIHRLRQTFQLEVPLRAFIEAPSIAEFAVLIEEMVLAEIENLTEEEAAELIVNS
ncbi:type I polyketide synthase [Oscillatoria salina]|uniref:type I polyketide synthase n=1 Tax=Oscillatoria salina TaxID=331517 RepID=UPI001CCDA5A2|nr:type I polyketide synthase [Oscillatoria salina]MBZ8179854.1 SDR family NAD(P)-dependent oxidoreductase [Oscillatoria salina IIICB1]